MDLLIRNARVIDGTGAPWFNGHVGIENGRIAGVYHDRGVDTDAEVEIDADGDVICPGFIDAHSHADLQLFEDPTLAPKVRQGVTTEILGQDGFSMAPIHTTDDASWRAHLAGIAGNPDIQWSWGSLSEYFDAIEDSGIAPNVASLVGHGTVRFEVMGMDGRSPTDAELEEMAELVARSLEEGAIGLSTGLVYPPQVNATTEEVQRLARELAPYGRPFVAHIRSEGRHVWRALDEFIDIGAAEDVPLHLSHYKLSGREQQGKADRANAMLAVARERGVDITADQYPYTAGNTMLSALLPPWVHGGSTTDLLERLESDDVRERIRTSIDEWTPEEWENIGVRTGWENIIVTNLQTDTNQELDGQSIAAIAERRDQHPADVVCDLLVEEELQVSMIVQSIDEGDLRTILREPDIALASDGLFGKTSHPRVYGTYPRVLGHYVREENVIPLPEAIRKMTSLPARATGLFRKGIIRPGMDADLVIFDPVRVASRATFETPKRFPVGISTVIVDGVPVVEDGETTGATPGSVCRIDDRPT